MLIRQSDLAEKRRRNPELRKHIQTRIRVEKDAKPEYMGMRRHNPERVKILQKETEKLLKQDKIERSDSDWATNVVLVRKKNGGWRITCDYRYLNSVTKKTSYPLPRIDDILDHLGGAKYYTTLDLTDAFFSAELHPDDRKYTAISLPDGLFQWKRLPQGLKNSSAAFVRWADLMMAGAGIKYSHATLFYTAGHLRNT